MDERLRDLQRRWLLTQDFQDLEAWDAEAKRSGYFGPILADAINKCISLAQTVISPDIGQYDFRDLQVDWDSRSIPIFGDRSGLVQDAPRIDRVVQHLLAQPQITWQDNWNRNHGGYPFGYELAYILDVLIHASKHGLIYTPEEQANIATVLAGLSGGDTLFCNLPHFHRRRGRTQRCTLPALECQSNDCLCYYGERALNVCITCHRRRTGCVCEQFAEIQIGNAYGGPVVIRLHPEPDLCQCHGGGWTVSDYDSVHQCHFHYSSQPHPDDPGISTSEPPLLPPLPPPETFEDDLPF